MNRNELNLFFKCAVNCNHEDVNLSFAFFGGQKFYVAPLPHTLSRHLFYRIFGKSSLSGSQII